MIITEVVITDFRNYSGVNKLDLETDDTHNIVLIGGQNGAGKTSMVDAIRLCLYGNRFNGTVLSDSKYQQYLRSVCNKNSKGGLSISLEIILNEENPPISINVERTFKKNGDSFDEELILRKSGSKVELIDHDYWAYYVEKLIPPSSSRYFFFDGEKVRDVMVSDSSSSFLSEAVDNLTGISNLKTLKSDLQELRKRILSKSKSATTGQIPALKQQISDLDADIAEKNLSIDDNQAFLDQYLTQYQELDAERSRLMGANNKKRDDLSYKLKESTSRYEDADRIVSEFCYSKLPFYIAKKTIAKTVSQATEENSSIIYQYSISALKDLLDDPEFSTLLNTDLKTTEDVIQRIIDTFSSRIQTTQGSLDISLAKIEQLKSCVPDEYEITDFITAVNDRDFYGLESNQLSKKLLKLNDNSIKELDNNISSLNTEIEVIRRQLEIEKAQLISLENKRSALESDLAREERLIVLKDVDKESISNIDLVLKNIDNRVSITLDDARSKMEKNINQIYHVLKNTQDMVKTVRLTDSFEIQLLDFDDNVIDTTYISEGEKGILMYSAVFALHSVSKSNFPLIVDSPLGRMDTKHVHNLANKYFPSIQSQIVLLSHDREVIGESLDLLNPIIKSKYTIRKTDKPKIISGYFE